MKLYLVQHGKAKPKEEDPQRPLSREGRSDVERVARFLAEHSAAGVGLIVHSGKTRARQTAEIMAGHLHPSGGVKEAGGLDPLAEPAVWGERLVTETSDLMLVGHLPHLDKLVSRLVCGNEETGVVVFQMGGVVCLSRDDSGRWRVAWMIPPDVVA